MVGFNPSASDMNLSMPKFAGTTEKAKISAAQTQLSVFATALDLFEVDNGFYPRGKDGLQALVVKPRDATAAWHPYMDSIPLDPWKNPYVYECPGKHRPNSYDLMSMGFDQKVGGNDDITNWDQQGKK